MSGSSKGRGAGPRDKSLFHDKIMPTLSEAIIDLSFLLHREYAEAAALKLVGDHFQLQKRQRMAVLRSSSDPYALEHLYTKHPETLKGQTLCIDGFNLIILIEAALGGGLIMRGVDGCLRDLSSVHGTYRMVGQTGQSIELIGQHLAAQQVREVHWYLDSPVSNSGRLTQKIREKAEQNGWSWYAHTENHVDKIISETPHISISTDKIILQQCQRWWNLGAQIVEQSIPDAWIIDLTHRDFHPPTKIK